MINFIERNREISFVLSILIAIEIYWFSSLPGGGIRTGLNWPAIVYHFVVFFLLSFFLLSLIKGSNKLTKKQLVMGFTISTIYAFSDEIHQYFVPGRSCAIEDLLTDSAGILSSLLVSLFVEKGRNKIKKKK